MRRSPLLADMQCMPGGKPATRSLLASAQAYLATWRRGYRRQRDGQGAVVLAPLR